ncbi:toxin secretion, membrane fusion protein [Anaerolineae bacterium CFX7]|nr:toxin secretion, membrane fusion protein [Anaerolineae bacterium CFX7]
MSDSTLGKKSKVARVVHKYTLGKEPRAIEYWRTQSYEARLAAVEEIRREYHGWTDETQPRLARVCRIVKRQ